MIANRTATVMENALRDRIIQIASPIAFVLMWEVVARFNWMDVRFFPAPSTIMATFSKMISSGEILSHLSISLQRIGWGFALGAIPALILGLAMGLFRWLRTILDPFVAFAYPIPKSSILPLIMVIFGLGEMTKIVTVALGVFFLVLINTIAGVRNIIQSISMRPRISAPAMSTRSFTLRCQAHCR